MEAIADALVYAVTYINCRANENDDTDADVGALESIAAILSTVTPAEEDALAAAAERALAAERVSASPRPEFLADFECWMEDIFGDDWEGNQRV